jgi:hypothetical protein
MTKSLRMKFTGNAVLTPAYPDETDGHLLPKDGPLVAIMPGARRRRPGVFERQQIDAQFAFLYFEYAQLVLQQNDDRDADYKYPDETNIRTGVAFLEREEISLEVGAGRLTFVEGSTTGSPQVGSRETKWIARWKDFSFGRGKLKPGVLHGHDDYVRVVMPTGEVSAGFVGDPIARIDFDYANIDQGETSIVFPYAQEIVLTVDFADSAQFVRLRCDPFGGGRTSYFTFTWGGRSTIELLFGNGSLASLQSVLTGSIAGHNHVGDYDAEFDVIYDIADCLPDTPNHRLPLPHIMSFEILRIPCIATMIDSDSGTFAPATADVLDLKERREAPSPSADTFPPPKDEPTTTSSDARTMFRPRTLPTQGRQRR